MNKVLDLHEIAEDKTALPDYGFCVGYCHFSHDNDLGEDGSDNPSADQAESEE